MMYSKMQRGEGKEKVREGNDNGEQADRQKDVTKKRKMGGGSGERKGGIWINVQVLNECTLTFVSMSLCTVRPS